MDNDPIDAGALVATLEAIAANRAESAPRLARLDVAPDVYVALATLGQEIRHGERPTSQARRLITGGPVHLNLTVTTRCPRGGWRLLDAGDAVVREGNIHNPNDTLDPISPTQEESTN